MTARKKAPLFKRGTRCTIGEIVDPSNGGVDPGCGDIVRDADGVVVVFGIRNHRVMVSPVDPETYRVTGKPRFLELDVEVQILARGVERWAKAPGGETDPLRGEKS
jgi:hypothetical protein